MELDKIIEIADKVYADGLVGQYHREPKGGHGDTLAKFIAVELRDTYDASLSDEEQIRNAESVLSTACRELESVREAFEDALTDQEIGEAADAAAAAGGPNNT